MQFLLTLLSIWFKVLLNRTKRSLSHITSFTMGQNHDFLAKIFLFQIVKFLQKMTKINK